MKALIVHYHLRPGGVTTVIRRQLSALAAMEIDAAVLTGEAPSGFGGSASVEPALGYDEPGAARAGGTGPDPERAAAIAASIRREADALGSDAVVHVHNPTIRKNSAMLAALSVLADSGRPLVLQVHDLAEDWRPDVYADGPYPDGATWAAINRHDARALAECGAGSVAFLPNPVPCPGPGSRAGSPSPGPGLVLYPVRGIRRKNLGEALLLSLFARRGCRIGVTLPPGGPRDLERYEGWRRLAASLDAPVGFGLGLERGLDELYAEAKAALTTSIKEGFGMSFLEPGSRGRATLGRRLPRVVPDFEEEGLAFPALYDSIELSPGLFDEGAFARRTVAAVEAALALYRRQPGGFPREVADRVLGSGPRGPDFGRLDEVAQAEVLKALCRDAKARTALAAANPFLDGWDEAADGAVPPSSEDLEPWSEARYGERLASLYRDALAGSGGKAPDKDALLRSYLRPEAYYGVGV